MTTLPRLLRECAARFPDRPALLAKDHHLTWQEVEGEVNLRCRYFLSKGVLPHSRVGIWSVNSAEYVLCLLAVLRLGCSAVLLNTALSGNEFLNTCRRSDLDWLFYGEGYKNCMYEPMVASLLAPSAIRYLPLWKVSRDLEGSVRSPSTTSSTSSSISSSPVEDLSQAEETALLLFTSGTTGSSKAVMLSHRSLLRNGQAMCDGLRWTEEDRICVSVPFFHCFGITACLVPALSCGLSLSILPRYRSESAFRRIQEDRCTVLNGVPSMFLAMYANEKRSQYDLSSIRSGIIAGSAISPMNYLRVRTQFGSGMHLLPSYGQTETSPCCTLSAYDEDPQILATTVGRPIEGVSLRICDERGVELPAGSGEMGEIQTRGYHLMQGYYGQPEETAAVFTEDGWLKTGDLGSFDEEGRLRILGRKKSLIIRGGENISPSELQFPLQEMPGIHAVHVLAVPDPILGDEICVCIQTERGEEGPGDEEIRQYLSERVSDYKIPRYILRMEHFPLTDNGKVALNELRNLVIDCLGLGTDTA